MGLDWNKCSLRNPNHVFLKFAASILLMGLVFRLFVSRWTDVSPVPDKPFPAKPVETRSSVELPKMGYQMPQNGKCDLFKGDWIPHKSGPIYTNKSCHFIEGHQNCMKNGRPDSRYLFWRWKPRNCELRQFDAGKFLKLMRNKSWALIGDSISRNHVQSLLCILSKVEEAIEVYHDKEYRSRSWKFPSYNFTLSVIWSPFLVKADTFEDMNGVSTSDIELYLDELDTKWVDQYHTLDYIIISGGKWFLKRAVYHENEKIVGCHYCPGKNLTELGYEYAYRKALQLVLNFIATSNLKGKTAFFRTVTPDHFENGEWFSGGTCKRKVPFKEGEVSLRDIDTTLRDVELDVFEKAAAVALKKNVKLKLFDTTQLSLMRPDGHPGPYRQFHPFEENRNAKVQNDCLHWCLPGPIDSWNDLLMEMMANS